MRSKFICFDDPVHQLWSENVLCVSLSLAHAGWQRWTSHKLTVQLIAADKYLDLKFLWLESQSEAVLALWVS